MRRYSWVLALLFAALAPVKIPSAQDQARPLAENRGNPAALPGMDAPAPAGQAATRKKKGPDTLPGMATPAAAARKAPPVEAEIPNEPPLNPAATAPQPAPGSEGQAAPQPGSERRAGKPGMRSVGRGRPSVGRDRSVAGKFNRNARTNGADANSLQAPSGESLPRIPLTPFTPQNP